MQDWEEFKTEKRTKDNEQDLQDSKVTSDASTCKRRRKT